MKNISTYDLMVMSVKSCRNCVHFKQTTCPSVPADAGPKFAWSSLNTCNQWTPSEIADLALQELTMRKLRENFDGQNVQD
jgi:hypothetical protein